MTVTDVLQLFFSDYSYAHLISYVLNPSIVPFSDEVATLMILFCIGKEKELGLLVVGMDEVFVLMVDVTHVACHLYRQTQKGAYL